MKRITIELQWAAVFFAMTLLWMLLEKTVGLHDTYIDKQAIYNNLIAIPAIAIYVFALLHKRKKYYGGDMTYGQGVTCGLIMTAFITLLSPLAQYITSTFITPQYFTNAIKYAVSKGYSTPAEAQAYFNLQSYSIQGLIGAPMMGVITTLIVAAFTKRTKPV